MPGSNVSSVTGVALRFDDKVWIDDVALFLVDDATLALSFASGSLLRRLLLFEASQCRSNVIQA